MLRGEILLDILSYMKLKMCRLISSVIYQINVATTVLFMYKVSLIDDYRISNYESQSSKANARTPKAGAALDILPAQLSLPLRTKRTIPSSSLDSLSR